MMKLFTHPSPFRRAPRFLKRMHLTLLLFVSMFASFPLSAQTFTYTYEGQTLNYKITGDNTAEVAQNRDISGDVIIPEEIVYNDATYSVTSIGEQAFDNSSSLTSVTIPNSVTSIGGYAFCGCTSLISITIPNSVTSIKYAAFGSCSSLTSITIPESVTSIGGSFSGCRSLESITVDRDNQYYSSVDGVLFNQNQSQLVLYPAGKSSNSYTIPNSVTSIGYEAFGSCSSLTSITIPESVTSIESYAFSSCSSLTSIIIPESVTSIGSYAFRSCSSLTSITIPNSVTSIGDSAFAWCSSLTSITIPNSVSSIGNSAFCSTSLTSINIPNSVTSIEERAFIQCYSLSSVTIPNSVTSIGNQTFSFCPNLKLAKIYSDSIFSSVINTTETTLAVPKSKLKEYKEAYPNNKVIPVDEVGFEPESYELAIKPGDKKSVSLFVDDFETVNGFQMDITLPVGLAIAEENGKLNVAFGEGTATASHTLSASKIAGNNSYRIVTYSSKNESFISGKNLLNIEVTADGNFKGGNINISNVIISTTDGEGYQGMDFEITTTIDYTLSIGEDISIEEGETIQLTPAVDPSIENLSLSWSSSNADVAYVNDDNILHAMAPGNAVITASNSKYGISASINVTVTPILLGDSNDNGIVTIDDVVTDVHYILEKDPQPFSFKKADVNRDTRINILDVSKTVAIVLLNEEQPQVLRAQLYSVVEPGAALNADNIRIGTDGRAVMTLRLNGYTDITALQGDIHLPEGVRISNIRMAGAQKGDHVISFADLKSGATRFAIYSMSLAGVTANSALIEVELECENRFIEGVVSVGDIYVSDTDCNLLRMEDLTVGVSGSSAVSEIATDTNTPTTVYNMQGVLLMRNASQEDIDSLAPGLYIIGGKKMQIR